MAELKSPNENTCSARLSQEEIQMPLSPVIGSGQSVKKLRKNRKERHTRDFNKFAQKLENSLNPQNETDKNFNSVQLENSELFSNDDHIIEDFHKLEESILNIEPIPGPSASKLSSQHNPQDMPENLLDRIQILEELENKRSNVIKALSFSDKVDLKTSKNTFSVCNPELLQINKGNSEEDILFQKQIGEKKPDTLLKDMNQTVNFQTCTGRGINIPEDAINKSTKLFDDILCPINYQSSRKNKFNYLSKCEHPEKYVSSNTLHHKTEVAEKQGTIINRAVSPSKSSNPDLYSMITADTGRKSDTDISSKRNFENIFKGENFNDIKLIQNCGFTTASEVGDRSQQKLYKIVCEEQKVENITLLQERPEEKTVANIFNSKHFGELSLTGHIGFNPLSTCSKELSNCIETDKEPSQIVDCFNKEKTKAQSFKNTLLVKTTYDDMSAKQAFKNIFENENLDDLNVKNFHVGFKPASISLNDISNCTKVDKRPIEVQAFERPFLPKTKSTTKTFRNIFEDENFDDLSLGALGVKFQSPLSKLKNNRLPNQTFESPYRTPPKNVVQQDTNNQSNDNFHGFSKEEQEITLIISESHCDILNFVDSRFKSMLQQNIMEPLINLSNIHDLSKIIYRDKLKFKIEDSLTNHATHLCKKRKFSELDSDHNSLCKTKNTLPDQNMKPSSLNTPIQNSFLKRPKKRLGCHFSPTIQISETVFKKARLLFEDLKPLETSTPIKFDRSLATPLACDLTPKQDVRSSLGGSFVDAAKSGFSKSFKILDQSLVKSNPRFVLNKPSEGDVKDWIEKLCCERRLIDDKQTILANQRTILEFSAKGKKRILPGVLYNSKRRKDLISLKDLLTTLHSEDSSTSFLNQINPQNARLVHFYIENKRQSHIQTEDGAVIVPTTEGRIGISEIEHSFKVMEAVDPKLLSKGWIQNHYKWIIWKLASYERMFGDKCDGCLCIENVVQQLKYRYDMEIDEVKRSALHKIFEKDDCPQRRLVLCVSRIMKVTNTYELELTDGWYPIRTVIDPLLCDQILKGKIKLGVKLMTYGAELVNCEGCHPLEATDQIYLKINYNSTRRAAGWSKLGCQKDSGPFLLSLGSVNMEGGKIGCIKCFISRVYPVKYMEKCGDQNVWRNRKAEERSEQEFYNEKIKALEKANKSLYSEHNKNDICLRRSNEDLLKSIRSVDDPEILYEIMQTSLNPESIQENLSSMQKTILYNYTINKSAQHQSKLVDNFNKDSKTLQERSVTSLLKIKIIDASCESNEVYDFHVWRPQDSHMQELKEGEIITIFNVSCSVKWGLSANSMTQYKKVQEPTDDGRYQKFRRHVTFIDQLQCFSKESEILTEFDTVGVLVKKKIGDHQQVWLADHKEKLLVIKIFDSPKNILVLDAVNEGQIVTVCNLIFKHSSEEYTFAVADHFVIFSRYSQYRHLQEAAESLEEEVKNTDLNVLLKRCKKNVDNIETKWDYRRPKLAWDVDDMDCSQITTTDLALLECVDKLT